MKNARRFLFDQQPLF